jgi:membrane protease YdiL (CAAX protease family)
MNEPAPADNPQVETYPGPFDLPSSPPRPTPIGPDNPPWGIPEAVIVWLVSVVLLILVPVVCAIPYVVYKQVVTRSTADLAADPNLIFVTILGVLPAHGLTFLVVWFLVTKRGGQPLWRTLGWTWPRNFRPLKTIGLAVLLLICGSAIAYFIGGAETSVDQIIKSSLKTRFATAFLAAVTGPLIEEIVYRGILYSAFERALGVGAAVAIVSALFAGVHVAQYYNNIGVILVITLLSVSLTLVRARSGSLLPSYVIHLVFNGIQAVVLVVQPFVEKPAQNKAVSGFLVHTLARFFG